MGMYTELIVGLQLKRDTPDEVINAVRYAVGDRDIAKPEQSLLHKINALQFGGSYYFAICTRVSKMWLDNITKCWHLSSRNNLKNYEQEIERFCEWIKPYVESGSGEKEIYAMSIYEESAEFKTYSLY